MKTLLIENTWLSMMEHGWGNGYVIIPKGHPMHGKPYDDIDVEVHGGLTFAETGKNAKEQFTLPITKADFDSWVVGFDTAHYMDTMQRWPRQAVKDETMNLKKQLEAIK